MLTYTRNLLAILLLLNVCSCKPKPEVQKEIVYKDYSLKQLKKYLEGTWVRVDNVTKDTLTKPFRFIYKSESETSGYMKPLIIENLHFTFFDIVKDKTGCSILFTPFMLKPDRKFHKIKKISNLELIIEDSERVLTYNKILEI